MRVRFSRLAEIDLAHILSTSEEQWGSAARRRYSVLIAAAIKAISFAPEGPTTRDRTELLAGLRSFHLRHARSSLTDVKRPVHVVYYRCGASGLVEVLRVLHERMEPGRHLGPDQNE